MGTQYHARVCIKGHLITDMIEESNNIHEYCSKCGSETIDRCTSCGTRIKGDYIVPNFITTRSSYVRPNYCENCGKPFPWIANETKRLNSILILDNQLTDEEKGLIRDFLPDLHILDDNTMTSGAIIRGLSERAAPATKKYIFEFVKAMAYDKLTKMFIE